jgi:adenylate cyclase
VKILAPARIARAAGIVLALSVISLFLAHERGLDVPFLQTLELKTYDMRLRALENAPPRHVTIAAIDEASLARLGRWPWSRARFAELAERLDKLGARVIAFDLFFPEHESPRADAQFAAAIAASKKVVLGSVFAERPEEVRHVGPRAHAEARLELQRSAAYVGHINMPADQDGVVRRAPLIHRYDGRYFPAFDVQAARAFLQVEVPRLEVAPYGLAGLRLGERYVPLDEEGRLLVRHRRHGSFATVSIADILEGRADAALVRDRVVLVGNTAVAIGDARVTPFGATLPGVEIRASIIESLLQGDVLQRPEWMIFVDAALMACVALVLVVLLPRLGVTGGGILAAAALGGYLFAVVHLFRSEGLWLNMVYPTLLVALLFAAATFIHYFSTFAEKRYLKRAFQHYVPPAVVENLVKDADTLRLGGEKRELTVLFSDIRGFTTLSEAMAPEELVKLMNEYFTLMTAKVFAHRGSLDKYIGDAIMAVYGAPIAEPQHPRLACRSALDMVEALRALQQSLRSRGLPPIDIGIGINTGPMIVGNMGSADRFNYTVVGDAVNLASRIEHLNKDYGTNVLVSEHTFEHVKDEFPASREVDRVQVRGRTQPVRLFELVPPGKFASLDWLEEYRAAYAMMREGDAERARALFAALHARTGDAVSGFHCRAA